MINAPTGQLEALSTDAVSENTSANTNETTAIPSLDANPQVERLKEELRKLSVENNKWKNIVTGILKGVAESAKVAIEGSTNALATRTPDDNGVKALAEDRLTEVQVKSERPSRGKLDLYCTVIER